MSNDRWVNGYCMATLALFLLVEGTASFGQQLPPEVARWGYADTIFVNGKVVSMDDKSPSTQVGSIYQAIAVKGDRIMKLGSDAQIRPMAGPDSRVFDLKGRTLLPGIVEPHSHIYGAAVRFLDRFGFTYPPKGIIVRAQADLDLEKNPGHYARYHPGSRQEGQSWRLGGAGNGASS